MPMRKIFTLQFYTTILNPNKTIENISFDSSNEDGAFKAPDHCIENIMNFARSYRVEDTKAAGKVEMMLN
jgi:hypothetical protein